MRIVKTIILQRKEKTEGSHSPYVYKLNDSGYFDKKRTLKINCTHLHSGG